MDRADAGFFDVLKSIFGAGDSAGQTAALNSQNMPLLMAPNNTDPLAGTGGGDITIVQNSALLSVSGPLGSLADVEVESRKSDQISIYIVREGDNLSSIAKMFGVSVNTIRWANDLTTSTVIKPGQTLIVLPINSIQHTVAKGETLKGIVKKYGGDLNETLAFNEWPAGYEPEVGMIVIVPDGEGEPLVNYGSKTVRGTGGPVYAGYYIRPINGGRISQGLHGLNAKDFATYCGAPIFASARGTVIIARSGGWFSGYGSYAVIAHPNGTQTLYSHMSRIAVTPGWNVVQGQVIGYVGSTGNSTGCHVHLEIRGAAFPNI
ncbi:MAG: M23 family metallopeptidase [Candidatus Niyogibacteria bacterium]|nr:MAG: M23 family metallopeptidase [Candidatus Niyogibacteria bacterium]